MNYRGKRKKLKGELMPKYQHLISLTGSSYLYTDKPNPTFEDLWKEYRFGESKVHPEDLDIEHIETHEIDDDYNEVRKVNLSEEV